MQLYAMPKRGAGDFHSRLEFKGENNPQQVSNAQQNPLDEVKIGGGMMSMQASKGKLQSKRQS